ncbi:hypothetical protein [Telmatospirillum sp.]|uniref:hypothetical protein n=1 Tax=Telmatospirillum sp. TaxID=2079197 RepID=UPI002841BB80|nr:hypothetical protein [Telmatospirillum sp.]MDR3440131.1 hypothetical protein [Telmatospirillum sp.]
MPTRVRNAEPEGGEGYFASVSDLMVGILFIFLLDLRPTRAGPGHRCDAVVACHVRRAALVAAFGFGLGLTLRLPTTAGPPTPLHATLPAFAWQR